MFMRTFEQRYTAWVDRVLSPRDGEAFAADHGLLESERAKVARLNDLVGDRFRSVQLSNPDFFSSQIQARIQAEQRTPRRKPPFLGVPALVWGGIVSVSCGVALFFALIPHTTPGPNAPYVAQVLKTKTDSHVTAKVDSGTGITVIELDGLDKVPENEDLSR